MRVNDERAEHPLKEALPIDVAAAMETVVREVQFSNRLSGIEVMSGKDAVRSEVQPLNAASPSLVTFEPVKPASAVQFAKALAIMLSRLVEPQSQQGIMHQTR